MQRRATTGWCSEGSVQCDKLPSPVLFVNVGCAFDVEQRKDLHPPVVLLEARRIPIRPVRLVLHAVARLRLRVVDEFPIAVRQDGTGAALPFPLALAVLPPVLYPVRADAFADRLEVAAILLDRLGERVERFRVIGRDKVVEDLFGVVCLDRARVGELCLVRDAEVLRERAGREAVLFTPTKAPSATA